MNRTLTAAALAFALLAPAFARAETPREWNEEHEGGAYRAYLKERHRRYHDWKRANRAEQRSYWRWRDSHPGEFR